MKNETSIKPAIAELERLFDCFAPLFGKDLKKAVITIQSNGRKANVLGWFWADRWSNKENLYPEINLSAEFLKRDSTEIAHTLIHEMVHLWNWQNDIKDCNINGYHNKKFLKACEEIGLGVEEKGSKGYNMTFVTPEIKDVIEAAKVDESAFRIFREIAETKTKAGTRMKKWTCGCTVIRCATDLEATCGACDNEFVEAD